MKIFRILKSTLVISSLFFMVLSPSAFAQSNYFLVINGDSLKMDLETPVSYTTRQGEKLSLEIVQPSILTYEDDMVIFNYTKNNSISNTVVSEEIEQLMIIKASGNGFLIQKYKSMNPEFLVSMMLNELVKESLNYGYTKKEKKFERTLKSGQLISGIEATLTYKEEKLVYTVAACPGKDRGLIIATMILNQDFIAEDKPFIDLMLNSLELKK